MKDPVVQFDTFYGIDGCRVGWFFVSIGPDDRIDFGIMKTLTELMTFRMKSNLFLVDIPIGLPYSKCPVRACETEARRLLSPLRHNSVFNPSCRSAFKDSKGF